MFDRYYCIKTNCDTWNFEIFEENEPVNLYFLGLKARGNDTFTACVLKTPLPGQIPTSCWRHVFTFATVHATDADVTFHDGPWMRTVKAAKQVYNSTWIALLKHGFVLVKTWLLIGDFWNSLCDVVFRACAYRWPSIHRPEVWPCIMKLWGLCSKITSKDFCFTSAINHAGKA